MKAQKSLLIGLLVCIALIPLVKADINFSVQNTTDELFRIDSTGSFYLYPLTTCGKLYTDADGLLSCGTDAGDNSSWNETHANTLYIRNNTAGWNLNITKLYPAMFYTLANDFAWTVTDDGSDIFMDFSTIGGINSFFLETAGTFLEMIANPGPANDYEMFAFEETQGVDTAINFYEGGTGHNRIWDSGSMRIGGGKSSLCSNLTTDVDCDTSGTGADLVVQDDGWFGGKLFSSDWTNVSITESQISDLSDADTNLTEDNVEAYIFDNDNTANLDMNDYNITVNTIIMENDQANHMIYDNSSCIVIKAGTTYLEVCE